MPRFVEQIKFLVFREQDGRWQIVAEYAVKTMAEDHTRELERAGYQAGFIRVRTRMPSDVTSQPQTRSTDSGTHSLR